MKLDSTEISPIPHHPEARIALSDVFGKCKSRVTCQSWTVSGMASGLQTYGVAGVEEVRSELGATAEPDLVAFNGGP